MLKNIFLLPTKSKHVTLATSMLHNIFSQTKLKTIMSSIILTISRLDAFIPLGI